MAEHVCPVWVGYLLASPLRKIFQNPHKIVAPYLSRGKKVMDIGSAMGFFSLPMAEIVKPSGKVYCVDLQEEMLTNLEKRARKRDLQDFIITHKCDSDNLRLNELNEKMDFVLIFAVLHEVPDQSSFLKQIHEVLEPGGMALLSEPRGHVKEKDFEKSLDLAAEIGFKLEDCPKISRSLSVIMSKNNGSVL